MSLLNWFKGKKQLVAMIKSAVQTISGLNEALRLAYSQLEGTQQNTYGILGAIALQHNGEVFIKREFLKMMVDNTSNLEVVLTNNEEGLVICVKELGNNEHS